MSGETGRFGDLLRRYRRRNRGLVRSLRRGWGRFTNHRIGILGLVIFSSIVAMALLAPFLAPHPPDWKAPSTGQLERVDGEYVQTGVSHPAGPRFGSLTGDEYFAPLGTTSQRFDVLSRLIFGSRTALYIGLVAGLLSSLVGVPLGLISGFYGDTWIDESIQRIVDIMYGLPLLPLVVVIVAVTGNITTTNIILAIVVKAWLTNAIVIRGETLSLKERPYIEAAKVAGASDLRILFRHILPNVLPLAFVYLAQDAAFAILTQANLAFIGLADPQSLTWGTMLQRVQAAGSNYIFEAWWWVIPPGVMITLLAASFYFVGYSLEDVMNPQTQA